MVMERCHFWLARFSDEDSVETYFAEPDEYIDDEPISQFAQGQNKTFYDHDFVFTEFDAEGQLDKLCELIGLPAETREQLLKPTEEIFNAIIAGDEEEFEDPQDVEGDPRLVYIGCFPCFVDD